MYAGRSAGSIFSTLAGLVTLVVDDFSFSVVVVDSFSVVVVLDVGAAVVLAAVSVPLLPQAVAPSARPAIPRIATRPMSDPMEVAIIAICQAGEFFGYTALLEDGIYHESAEALEPSEVTSIGREAFEGLINTNPEVTRQFVKLLAGNMHEREEQLLNIAYNSLRKKVAEALIMLHRKYSGKQQQPVPIHISRENLAAIAGTAKESLIRTLGDFRDEGLIEIRGTDIVVTQERRLAQLLN